MLGAGTRLFMGFVVRIGLAVAVFGAVAILTSLVWPETAGDSLAAASEAASLDESTAPPPPSWRDGVRLAGGICLVAGIGLAALALVPQRRLRE